MDPFEIQAEVVISPVGVRRLRQGHLWIYSGDVLQGPGDPRVPFVKVLDSSGRSIGYALYSHQSRIRLRFLGSQPPTMDLFRDRLKRSIDRRSALQDRGNACRLVFGEADLLPSIIVDRYADYLSLQTLSAGADLLKPVLVSLLCELAAPSGIVERNDVKARLLEGLDEVQGMLWGSQPGQVEISEGGVRFNVDLSGGQKTGFFLDQSENRIATREYASGRVLDCFTNTGAFALHFSRRAESVLAVDVSRDALVQAERNAALNNCRNVEFREANVFDLLRELERSGEKFDLVCLDPPAFAKNRGALTAAKGGYKEINLRAMKLLRPEGILVTSSCSYHMAEPVFAALIEEAAHDARRYAQILERRSQARDHPILAGMPETHYLKCFVLRVL